MSSTIKASDEKKTFWTKIKTFFCRGRLDNSCEAVQVTTADYETVVTQKNDTALQQETVVVDLTAVTESYENVDFARQPFFEWLHGMIKSEEPAGQSMLTGETVTQDSAELKPPTVWIECDLRLKSSADHCPNTSQQKSTTVARRELVCGRHSRVLRDQETELDWFLGLLIKWDSLAIPQGRGNCGAERNDDPDGLTDDEIELERFATTMRTRESERDRLWAWLAGTDAARSLPTDRRFRSLRNASDGRNAVDGRGNAV